MCSASAHSRAPPKRRWGCRNMRASRSTGQLQPHCAGHSIKKIMEELMKSLEAPKQDDQHENEVPKEVVHLKIFVLL